LRFVASFRMISSLRALELAIAHGDVREVDLLLDAEPDLIAVQFPENVGLTPLMWACRNRHASIVELLLDKGADVNAVNPLAENGDGGNTALWFAAQGAFPGATPIARLLLDHGAPIDVPGESGTTPFFMAVVWVHMELVQFFLSRGANPLLGNAEGKTPLQAVRDQYERLQGQEKKTEEIKRLGFRAPRMISFLEKLTNGHSH